MAVTREARDAADAAALSMVQASPVASSARGTRKPKDRGARFNEKHTLKYGLSICSRNTKDNSVEMVMCKFCVAFGKESAGDTTRKRRATANIKYFRQPFRADHYLSHMEINHKTKWAEYERATMPEKEKFFSANAETPSGTLVSSVSSAGLTVTAAAGSMMQVRNGETGSSDTGTEGPAPYTGPVRLPVSEIEKDVVEVLVGELMFDSVEEQGVSKEQALEVFVGKAGTENYEICIKNQRLYDLAIKFIACGTSYRLASRLVQTAREETQVVHYGGCTDLRVAGYVRAIIASNLQRLAWMMRAAWGYAITTEVLEHQGTAYLDVRLHVWHNCGLCDFHILVIPAFDRLPAPAIIERIQRTLDSLDPRWRVKILGTTADGGASTGRNLGLTSTQQNLAARLTALVLKPNFYLIWSAVHQLEIVAKNCVVSFCDKVFYRELVRLVSAIHIRTQQLRQSSQHNQNTLDTDELPDLASYVTPPRGFVQALLKTFKWLLDNRFTMSALNIETEKLSPCWWIGVCVAQRLMAEFDYFMKRMLSMEVGEGYISDQIQELSRLALIMKDVVGATRELWDPQNVVADEAAINGSFLLSFQSAQQFIQNEGGPVAIELFDSLRNIERVQISKQVAHFAVDMIAAVASIAQEGRRYNAENSGVVVTPPRVMPYDVYQMGKDDYMKLLQSQEERLRETFTAQEIRRMQNEYYYFVAAIESEPILSSVLQKHSRHTDVTFAWSCMNNRVPMLQEFVGTLATVVPEASSSSLQIDLNHLNWEKPDYRLTTVDFALEGILHARQKMRIEVVDVNHARATLRLGDGVLDQGPRPVLGIDTATPVGGSEYAEKETPGDQDESMEGEAEDASGESSSSASDKPKSERDYTIV